MKTLLLTCFALIAFAGNSILCRVALKGDTIDASSFTAIRLLSGGIFLAFLLLVKERKSIDIKQGSWLSALLLFVYMIAFSYSYISINTGVGALILFGFVQVTMMLTALIKGEKLLHFEWLGLFISMSGFIFLLLPSASTPSLSGFLLMAISGIAWGFYTLAGKGSLNPLHNTTSNFLRTIPFIVLLFLVIIFSAETINLSNQGVLLAVASGAIMSGLGYAAWYATLNDLSITQASVLQLTVPIIATFGGVIFLNEQITTALVISSLLVLGGILIVTIANKFKN